MEKVSRLQKRAACLVLNVPRMTPSLHVFSELRLMSIYQRAVYLKCLAIYNIVNNNSNPYLNKFIKSRPRSNYNLRSELHNMLQVPFPNAEMFKKSFQYSAVIIWNNLSDNIKNEASFSQFKQKCKQFIFK